MDVIGNGRYDSRCGPMSSTLRRLLANQVDILLAAKSLDGCVPSASQSGDDVNQLGRSITDLLLCLFLFSPSAYCD